jgi:photosystem II stability/assembly factor-like uncharacterized protein
MNKRFSSLKPVWLSAFAFALCVSSAQADDNYVYNDPDAAEGMMNGGFVDKEGYINARERNIGQMRGVDENKPFNPQLRIEAIRALEMQERLQARGALPDWGEIGPAPIPNGQTVGVTTPVSGRVISIAVHPTNPDLVYVGAASGGLYRTSDGGTTWVPLMDNALSLSIGAIAIAPSQPDTVYVGTGEHNFSLGSFFGVGVYRITNASSATPTVAGPFNLNASAADVFTGRGIGEILVHPTNPDIIFVASTSGGAGIGTVQFPTLPSRGVYRSTNATAASPVFEKLTGLAADANSSVRDIIIDPLNPNLLVANVVAASGVGGIYVSTNALATPASAPTFTQRVVFNSTNTSELTAEFAIHHTDSGAPNPTIYAAVGNLGGRVLINTDGGTTWTEQIDNNFCTAQCFYDIAVAVAPNDATRVYLGGSPTLPFGFSTNSGVSFTTASSGLHVDSHVIAVSQSNPTRLYFGSDGGIYRSNDSGATWIPLNNTTFRATQFMSMAVHPTDFQFTIGGTQDNGTQFRRPDATWTRADFGDGGYSAIDQNAADTTNVRMYHTYFNNGSLQGYGTVASTASASDGNWAFRGCQAANATVNGITCTGAVQFYAPITLGPGNPNTIYYGSDRLYRSDDTGLNHTVVSQAPITAGVAISAIEIAPSNDNVRFVGQTNGGLFRVTDGSATMVSVDPVGAGSVIPDNFIGRIAIHPTDPNIAYVMLAGFPGAGQTVWKTTNLLSAAPTFAVSGTGLPNAPANAFVFRPGNPNEIYVGTDIGVFQSLNAGATWTAFSNGLPRVPVFGLEFTGPNNGSGGSLRAATHGRGMWDVSVPAPPIDNIFANGFE